MSPSRVSRNPRTGWCPRMGWWTSVARFLMTIVFDGWTGPSAHPRSRSSPERRRIEHTFTVRNGTIKIDSKPQEVQADTATDVLMQHALMRRALAFDQANLMEFTKCLNWTDKLMKARLDKPPSGFERPSNKQLMAADTKLFEEMADLTRQGIHGQHPWGDHSMLSWISARPCMRWRCCFSHASCAELRPPMTR